MFAGWTEDPKVTRERMERIAMIAIEINEPDCACQPNDDQGATACDACIAQAERRYQEIPY